MLKKHKIFFRDAPVFLVSINELFINEFYKFRTNKDQQNKNNRLRILYWYQHPLYFKINYPNAQVRGFEPDSENFSLLKTNTNEWAFSNTQIENAAILDYQRDSITFNAKGSMASRIESDHTGNQNNSGQMRQVKGFAE